MAKRKGKKLKNNGSLNSESSSRIIEKSAPKGNSLKASGIRSTSHFIHTAAPNFHFSPAYPHVPALASAPMSTGSCNLDAVRGEMIPCADQIYGYIFMCNGKTKVDCYRYRVFGLPAARMEVVEKIKPHMKLFLFDFDSKLLYGVYVAISSGDLAIEPTAFGGKFPAQVRFGIFKDCLPLHESGFKHVIQDNYRSSSKFRQELSDEQVANLISLFRPIDVPRPVTAVSLIPHTVPPAAFIPPSIELQTRPAAELSASYDQYLSGLQLTHAGVAGDSQHVRQAAGPPFVLLRHASVANMAGLQLDRESKRLLPLVPPPQPHCEPYYPAGAHQAYFTENPALHRRYTALPDDTERGFVPHSGTANDYYHHCTVLATSNAPVQATFGHGHAHLPYLSSTAAYWAQIAAEQPNQLPSRNTTGLSLGAKSVPVSIAEVAPTYPAVPNRERETVLQSGIATDENLGLALAATNGPDQRLPSGVTGLGPPMNASFSGAAPSYTSVVPEKEIVLQSEYGYHHNIAVSSANVPLQEHFLVTSHEVPAPLHGPAYLPSSSATAAYWAADTLSQVYFDPHHGLPSGNSTAYVYNHNVAVSATNAPFQAHAQVPSQVLPVHMPSSSPAAAAYWNFVASQDPNQVYHAPH